MATKTNTQITSSLIFLLPPAALLLFLLIPTISATHSSKSNPNTNATDFIHISCNTTLYPDLCYYSLSPYATTIQQNPAQLARIALSVTLTQARRLTIYVSNLARQTNSGNAEPRAIAALHDCYSTFGDAVDQIRRSIMEMRRISGSGEAFKFQMSNVQTWMSAALTNEDTCTDGFQGVSNTPMKADVCDKVSLVNKYTSNALALLNCYVANLTQLIS